jgi:hypothetical protein
LTVMLGDWSTPLETTRPGVVTVPTVVSKVTLRPPESPLEVVPW